MRSHSDSPTLCSAFVLLVATGLAGAVLGETPERLPSPPASAQDLAVTNSLGQAIPLLSIPGAEAEFRHLMRVFRETDLTGPPVRTDGWTYHIREAEWPLMGFSYAGYAGANLARIDPSFREEAFPAIRWLLDALQTPRMSGFVREHFGDPFGPGEIHVAVFVHGHFLSLATRYREVSQDPRYDSVMHRVAAALATAFHRSDQGILASYRDMWWVTDNLPAWSALVRYDRLFGRKVSRVKVKFLESIQRHYLDPTTGMFATYVSPRDHRILQGPRGISQMYGLHFLRDIDPSFAARQYDLARKHLFQTVLGIPGVREFPEGVAARADVDSGQIILGLGPSASGFGIAAAALNGDLDYGWKLARAASALGGASLTGAELKYERMPPVGQAVILFGKSELLKTLPTTP